MWYILDLSCSKLIRARQSSTYGELKKWDPINAIDGDVSSFSVAYTSKSKYHWWEAELEQPTIAKSIKLVLGKYAFEKGTLSFLLNNQSFKLLRLLRDLRYVVT